VLMHDKCASGASSGRIDGACRLDRAEAQRRAGEVGILATGYSRRRSLALRLAQGLPPHRDDIFVAARSGVWLCRFASRR